MPKTQGAPRVLGVVGEIGGCSLYRIIMPFAHLKAKGYTTHWAPVGSILRESALDYDILVLARLSPADDSKLVESRLFFEDWKSRGKKIVYEMDDDLLGIPEDNPGLMPAFAQKATLDMIRYSDLLTVTNDHLADAYWDLNPHSAILPNCVDPDIWTFTKDKAKVRGVAPGKLTIGVHGGDSHARDWLILKDVIPEIAQRHPEVHFVFAGYHPPWLDDLGLDDRLSRLAWVPIDQYPLIVSQIDIGLCPLEDTPFNRSKSEIKYMEHAMCSAPTVCSPVVYDRLVLHGRTGFLAQGPAEWIDSITKLIVSSELRKKMGAAARGHVLHTRCIHDLAPRWMQTYRNLWQAV